MFFVGCSNRSTLRSDGATPVGDDASTEGPSDGTPTRKPCATALPPRLGGAFGRLDGYLTAVAGPGRSGCHADPDHAHLQVETSDGSYDIAVNVADTGGVPVAFATLDVALPDGLWSEGWHSGYALDYPGLGVHAADFTPTPKTQLAAAVEKELANANHISVFATPYADGTGAHDIHRKTGGNDGALIVRPTDAQAHVLLFHFQSQVF